MPQCGDDFSDDNGARLSDRERRDRALLDDALTAAIDALYARIGTELDVRVLVVAIYGDRYAGDNTHPEGGRSVPVHARFSRLDNERSIADAEKRYLSIDGVRAASTALFAEMRLGGGRMTVDRAPTFTATGRVT
jgi:hypothetical protein